jgi:outer membrane autotransporter protein
MANIAVTTANVQLTNLGLRLSSLRQGARGVNISGLSLAIKKDWVGDADFGGAFIGEGRWPGEPDTNGPARPSLQTALAPLLPGGPTGAGASAEGSLWGGLGIFINGQGSFGDQSTTSREPGFDFHTAGVTVGADYRFTERLVLGTAVGYLATDSELNGNAGESDARGVSVSAFGTYYVRNQFYLEGIATYGWNDYDTERTIDVNSSAKGETHGNQLALSAGGGYDFNFGRLTLGAQARATYIKVEVSGYTEQGPSMFNLNVGSQTVESVTTALGGQATYAIGTAWGVLSPTVRAEWEHEYKDDSPTVRGTLVVDPAGTGFLVRGNTPDRDYFNLGAGLSMTFRRGTSGFVFYETVVGRSDIANHLFIGGIRLEF